MSDHPDWHYLAEQCKWLNITMRALLDDATEKQSAAAEIERLRTELETERMRIVACGVAALGNTEASAAQRICRDSPYWSASYGDVCDAVDREMALRSEVEALRHDVEAYRGALGYAVSGDHDGRLSNGTLPVNGIADALQNMAKDKPC